MMIQSGDKLKVIHNYSRHDFKIGEEVYFIGVVIADDDILFVCTNGKREQSLFWEDIEKKGDKSK